MGAKARRFAPIPRGGGRQSDGSRSVGGCPLPGYFSFAAAYALQPLVGSLACAFLIVGGVYLLLLILIVLFRHQLIQRPLVKFLAHLLMSK